jgi:hypothetical protein
VCHLWIADMIRGAHQRLAQRSREGDVIPKGRCHPSLSRLPAPCDHRSRVNRAQSPVRPTAPYEGRIAAGIDVFAPTPSIADAATVLGGVKGARAELGGCAALDAASARCALALSMALDTDDIKDRR